MSREENTRSRCPVKSNKAHTGDLSRRVGAKKHKPRVRMDSELVLFDYVAVLSYVFCVTTKSRVKRLYSTLHNHKLQEGLRTFLDMSKIDTL